MKHISIFNNINYIYILCYILGPTTSREETVKYQTEDGKVVTQKVEKSETNFHPDDLLARINEVGVFEQDGAWSNYSSYRNVTQQTIKKFMLS